MAFNLELFSRKCSIIDISLSSECYAHCYAHGEAIFRDPYPVVSDQK